MKKAFLILLAVFLILYGKIGIGLFAEQPGLESASVGLLSEMAEEVTAIPLLAKGMDKIEDVRNVQMDGDNLFLISGNSLYRFDKSGKPVCRITDPSFITVAGYLIDSLKQQLVVMGNENDVFYYSFSGELLSTKKLEDDSSNRRIHCAAIFGSRIWTTEECISVDAATQTQYVEKQVVEYDTSFNKLTSHKLVSSNLQNNHNFNFSCDFELGISEDTGTIYAYSPPIYPERLLLDTLSIRRRQLMYGEMQYSGNVAVYPLRLGSRYWISSYRDPADPSAYYTFCFDRDTSKSWHIKGGFKDNICHTGNVPVLNPMDVHSNSYYFCKKDKSENPVVYIVRLKA